VKLKGYQQLKEANIFKHASTSSKYNATVEPP